MAITTYSELQQAIADWMNRGDLSAVIPSFIANAEARLNRRIRCRAMETTENLTLNSDGEASVPSDFLEEKTLMVASTPETWPEYVESDAPEFLYKYRPYSGPQYWTIMGTTIKVKPAFNGAAVLYYFQRIPALSGSNTTNWLLTKAPEVYLYATCLEAAMYLKDEAAAVNYTDLMMAAIDELLQEERASKNRRTPAPPVPPAAKTQDMDK